MYAVPATRVKILIEFGVTVQNPRKRQSCQWRPPINQPHAHLLIHLNTLALPSKHFPVFLNLPIGSPLRSLNRTLPI